MSKISSNGCSNRKATGAGGAGTPPIHSWLAVAHPFMAGWQLPLPFMAGWQLPLPFMAGWQLPPPIVASLLRPLLFMAGSCPRGAG
jgi:hypothetical protein